MVGSSIQNCLSQLRHVRDRLITAAKTAQSMQGVSDQRLSASAVLRRIRSMSVH